MTRWSDLSDEEAIAVVRRAIETWFRGSHYVNVHVRRNGKDEMHEADWLKDVPQLLERVARVQKEGRA